MQAIPRSYEGEINETVTDLFMTMLSTEATATSECARGQDAITSIIAFAGPWKGNLLLECGRTQAVAFTKRFLQLNEVDEHSEDVFSTVAELSNIVAGNLKVVLPHGVSMSTPSIIEGSRYDVRVHGGKLINEMFYTTDVGPFTIRLIEACSHTRG